MPLFGLGLGAVFTAILYYIFPNISLALQILIWSALSLMMAILWFRLIKPRSDKKKLSLGNAEQLQGEVGLVIRVREEGEQIKGRLRFPAPLLGDDEWNFNCAKKIKIGDKAQVIGVFGNNVVVKNYEGN